MGQKVNPHGLRVGVIKDWDSRWFTTDKKEFGNLILEDHNVRKFLKNKLYSAGAVSYTHLTLPTTTFGCRSRWSPYH